MVRRGFDDIQMTSEEIDEFLQVPRYGALATVKSGERPHIDPVGFNYIDGKIYFSCEETRVLVKRIRNNANGFFSVFDDSPPASAAVQLEGPMRIVDDPDDMISKSIIRRHAAENLGTEFDSFVHAWLGNGKRKFKRVVIELAPTKVFAWNNRKTAAARRRAKVGTR